jgi:TolB-like protein/Tfp pilus assembly protein PilF
LIHRDLKPANIMLTPNDATPAALEAKVIDFGLAKATAGAADEMDITHGAFVGTPTFASPEQFAGKAADARSDIYSLGVTLWYALTGEVPYPGKTIEEIRASQKEVALPVHQLSGRKVPAPLIKLLRQTLAINPVERPQSARALLGALELCRAKMAAAPRRRRAALLYGLLAIGAVGLTSYLRPRPPAPVIPPEKSIAVLPFENLSPDPDNAYFADGIQEEILTRLAGIAGLRVISRASTQQYQSKPRNLGEIAKQLGVANILEGSVQKTGDQVRVNVQLINAQTDSHLWADTYDRKLTDIFGVESEIAKRIAESLQAKLSGHEEQALAVKPTNNLEAYDLYLRGLSFEARFSSAWQAVDFYEQAVQLDPNFAIAWARLSRGDADIYSDLRDTAPGRRDAAKRALENAQKLQPNSPETLLALGYYQYRVLRDYGAAKTTFGRVGKTLPGSTEVPYALAEVARREGNWDQSIAYYEQALALDPRDVELLREAALTYSIVRQFSAALKLYDRALDIAPNDPELMASKAKIYQAQGNLQEAGRFLSEINGRTAHENTVTTKLNQLRLERNYGEAIGLLQSRLAQFHFTSELEKAGEQTTLAFMQRLAGDTAGAKATAEQARNTLESVCKNQPDNAFAWSMLASANALIGERDLALNQMTRSMTLLPSAKDPMLGPVFEQNLPRIETIFGETSRPISTLARLLQTPSFAPLTPALLRLDPVWDPLRTDPAFQKLCEEKQPSATP